MHIPYEIDNNNNIVRFDYIVGYTLLEYYYDQAFIDNFRYNIILLSEIVNTGKYEYYVAEIAIIILSLNSNKELKHVFEELFRLIAPVL
jgi:hypothetical protein